MADAIVIKIGLDASDIGQATGKIRAGIKSALDAALPDAQKIGSALSAGFDEAIKKAEKLRDLLKETGSGGRRGGGGGSSAADDLKKQEAAMLRLAQATARLKQISGDTQGAIKVLGDAIAKASDPKGINAVRAEIQKTYLTTNYNNSPLISAIRATKSGFEGLPPIISKATGLITGLLGGLIGGGLIAGFQQLGSVALGAAIEIDKSRQTIVALTGSTDAANRKLVELRDLAQKTPGLTSRLAIEAFAQLKATGQIADESINKLISGIGRLNAVFTIDDAKQFSRNLVQIFQQGFERADIKEALGRVPIFEQILQQAFGTNDPDKLRKLKDSGKLTLDSFASGLADAISSNPVLSNVQESLGSRFEKAKDNILVALEPLGAEIGQLLLRFTDELGKQLEQSRDTFSDLIESAKDFGRTLTDGVDLGQFFNLQKELNDVKALIDFVNGGVLFLKDSFELLGTLAVGVVKQIALTIEQALAGALSLFGIEIGALNEDIVRLSGDLSQLENRFNQGFVNTRNFQNRAQQRDIVVDAGNAIPIDVNTGRPLDPSQATPFKPSGGRSRGGSSSAESKARQLREAQLSQQKTFLEQNQRLLEDANKRELETVRELYDQKSLTAQQYFAEKTRLEQASISASISVTQQEIANAEAALAKTKPGTVERIRLEAELFKLRTDLTIKSREFYAQEINNIQATTKALLAQRRELQAELERFTVTIDDASLPSAQIGTSLTPEQERAREVVRQSQRAEIQFRVQDIELQRQEIAIQNAISAGVLTEAEGRTATLAIQRQYRDLLIQSLEIQKQATIDPETIGRLNVQIEQLKTLGQELSPTQAFFKGFRSEAETLAESFERIGRSFKDSVLGVVDSGIDKLTQKLGFFKSLVGDILKSLTRVLLGGLLQPRNGGASGGGGIGGFLGSLLGGGGGGGFATGGFAGGGGAASILGGGSGGGGLLGALSSALGGGISAPRSLSLGGLPIAPNIPIPGAAQLGGGGGFGSLLGGLGGGLGSLFKGIGFGKAGGSGGALAGALPLLGLSLGASVGTDRLTSIIGGVGGAALGIGLSAAPGIIGAGGALSGLGFLAPLFSNPITAIAGGVALVGALLLGRARQRRRDEKSSGDALQDAVNQIKDVRKQVESNELTLNVSQARELFNNQILQPFIAQISQLKSKSVRESRLKNQTVDLKNLFEKEVIPAVQAQKAKQGINDKLIPEFAFGGIVPGRPTPGIDSVLARLSPGEMVLTTSHQAALQSIAGRNVFQSIGVPNAGESVGDGSTAFARGGFVGAASRLVDSPPTINMTVQLVVSGDEAVELLNAAASTDSGQQILVNARKMAQRNRLTR